MPTCDFDGMNAEVCVICVGFDVSDRCDTTTEWTQISLVETFCILGLPAECPAKYEEAASILQYRHASIIHDTGKVTCNDFVRLLSVDKWISSNVINWFVDRMSQAARDVNCYVEKAEPFNKLVQKVHAAKTASHVIYSIVIFLIKL